MNIQEGKNKRIVLQAGFPLANFSVRATSIFKLPRKTSKRQIDVFVLTHPSSLENVKRSNKIRS